MGREVFLRLVEHADVVITNFKPGTMEEWGLGYADAARRNERIIYAMGSSFGTVGPDARPRGRGPRRSGRRRDHQHDGRQAAPTRARSAPPSPTTSRGRTCSPASWPRCTHGSGPAGASSWRPPCSAARSGPRPVSSPSTSCRGLPRDRATAVTRWSPASTACSARPTAGSPSSGSQVPCGTASTRPWADRT